MYVALYAEIKKFRYNGSAMTISKYTEAMILYDFMKIYNIKLSDTGAYDNLALYRAFKYIEKKCTDFNINAVL